ncbi:hypothetical protein OBBRIDRAFT_793414 [Obba rivulosa]|uniref:MARVEL domain-containing protein n=1 Tax=Obba rivulosa TaxID=1052685 RepID=A0A8E2DJE5_9APHY|nr:hypothetical protein OBBRIDRAFT_793414 [Obba rivulosa]
MPLLDSIQDFAHKVLPEKRMSLPMQSSTTGGIGSGGMVPFEDDMIVSKPAIIFHASQAFFSFLAMCCFASVAQFQAKWHVGPSGLSGFAVFTSVVGIILPLFMLFVPVIYEKYNKGARLARAMKEVRVGFILVGTGTTLTFLIAFITTISAWTEAGCKNADKDPHASLGDSFKNGLSGWCSTKKAGAVFFWLGTVFWFASLTLAVLDWRNGKTSRPRDPPFVPPAEGYAPTEAGDYETEYGDTESQYHADAKRQSSLPDPFDDPQRQSSVPSIPAPPANPVPSYAPRPSIDAYGAFSDPAPTGFAPNLAAEEEPNPRVSRTMQYADPYAVVRATVAAGVSAPPAIPPPSSPPSYGYGAYP